MNHLCLLQRLQVASDKSMKAQRTNAFGDFQRILATNKRLQLIRASHHFFTATPASRKEKAVEALDAGSALEGGRTMNTCPFVQR